MYNKRCMGFVLSRKTANEPSWVKWRHGVTGLVHCSECLRLNGCWFSQYNAPPCPHHDNCHCWLEPIDYFLVLAGISTHSDYSKFDPYLFDPENNYKHGKNKIFESWGYSIADALWLKGEIERQAARKYASGEYILGKLDGRGQRISIRIAIPRKDGQGDVSFITGWMVLPNGELKLNTPYGGK